MALQSVTVRPQKAEKSDEIEVFIEELIGQPLSTTASAIPVFSFKTTEENVEKIKSKWGNEIILDAY
ncbi:hypothetical protein GGI43DRAFT_381600 [Trichoderma evansii]